MEPLIKSFCGIPIEGELTGARARVEQLSENDYANLVRPLIEDENIISFGWKQYTPYFNDGDVCEFGVGDLWIETRVPGDVKINYPNGLEDSAEARENMGRWEWEGEWEEMWCVCQHPVLGDSYAARAGHDPGVYPGFEKTAENARMLTTAMGRGALNDVLLFLFGDHTSVTVRKDRIVVDFYEHD